MSRFVGISAALCLLAVGLAAVPTGPAGQVRPLSDAALAIQKAGGRFSRDYLANLEAFLEIKDWTGTDADVARFAELNATQYVSFSGKQPDAVIAGALKMPSLRAVGFSNPMLSDAQARQVAALDVDVLNVSGGEGVLSLQGHGKFRRMRIEYVEFTAVTLDGFASLENLYIGAGPKFYGKPVRLNLRGLTALKELEIVEYRPEGLKLTDFPALETVNFYNSAVPDSLLAELAKVPKLKAVGLTYAENGDAALRALADSSLETLGVSSASDEAFARVGDLSKLVAVSLAGKNLTGASLLRLGNSPNLRSINFGGKVNATSLAALSRLTKLEMLSIADTGATDEGVLYLGKLPALAYLQLGNNPITDKSLEVLGEVKTLQEIDIRQTKVTLAGVEKLKAALPKARIVADVEK